MATSKPTKPAKKKTLTAAQVARQERLAAAQAEQRSKAKRRQRTIIAGAIVLAVIVVAVFVVVAILAGQAQQVQATVTPPGANADRTGIVVNPGKNAPHTVSIYLDYQCPGCKQLEDAYGSQLEQAATAGKINLEYRTLTMLDGSANKNSSTRAAVGAACADVQGAYSAYHDQVFSHQPDEGGSGYSDQQLRVDFPSAAGLSGDKLANFQQCYDQRLTGGFVSDVSEKALEALPTIRSEKNASTPTVVIDGKEATTDQLTTLLQS